MWVISTEKILLEVQLTTKRNIVYNSLPRWRFKRLYNNKQGYFCSGEPLGFKGSSNQKANNHNWRFQMSHIEVCPSAGFCSFIGTHTSCLWWKMLRLASGHSCSSSEVTTALISFGLQVILDPCAAIGNLYKEMKFCRTLKNLVSLKGRALSIVNESKLNHNKPLHSGQIFRLAVKSYLRLTGCDGRKWYVVTIVETAALLLQSCLHDAQVVVNCRKPALRNIKLLVGSGGSDFLI